MYYEDTIYPLQDKVLAAMERAATGFYLTGGTALSRYYLKHRYSDDLDFFVNDDNRFADYMKLIYLEMNRSGIKTEKKIDDERFNRFIAEGVLKVEFVNDVPFYFGEVQIIEGAPYSRTDNILNILSNKITAFRDREEAKDIVDIREIAVKMKPDWRMIFEAADSKAAGIFPPEIAEKMETINPEILKKVKWIKEPDYKVFVEDIKKIAGDILQIK